MVDLKGKTLYEALGVAKDATQADIRKAYMRLALQLHPDKNPGDEAAVQKFQTLQKVYAILSDAEKRKVYDQTGSVDDAEELAGEQFNELYNYYRSMYAKVTEDDLEQFHDTFRGGEEERAEVLKYYQRFAGDMSKVFEWVMCSNESADAHRFMDLLDAAIAEGEVQRTPKYTAWAKRVAAKPRPKAVASGSGGGSGGKRKKQQQQKGRQEGEAALIAAIRGRQGGARQPLGGVLGQLLVNMPDEPSEEAFQAAAARLKQKGSSGSGSSGSGKQKAATGSSKRAKK